MPYQFVNAVKISACGKKLKKKLSKKIGKSLPIFIDFFFTNIYLFICNFVPTFTKIYRKFTTINCKIHSPFTYIPTSGINCNVFTRFYNNSLVNNIILGYDLRVLPSASGLLIG
jgi:hypothetical protein